MENKGKKIRILPFDESRIGLIGVQRRKITLKGVKPVCDLQYEHKSLWLYGAFDVLTGESYYWEFRNITKTNFSMFINKLSNEYKDSINIVLMDNSKTHFIENYPDNIKFINIEAYSPELNPSERVWQYIKDKLAWKTFKDLEELYDYIKDKINEITNEKYKSLISYPYIIDTINSLNIM